MPEKRWKIPTMCIDGAQLAGKLRILWIVEVKVLEIHGKLWTTELKMLEILTGRTLSIMGTKMNTNFFCTNFLNTSRGLEHPSKIPRTGSPHLAVSGP